MQYFHYERSPRSLSIQYGIGYGFCILCFLTGGLYLVIEDRGSMSVLMGKIFLFGSLLAIPKSIWHILKIKKADQNWKITISDQEVVWDAPNNLGRLHDEKSFRLKLNEIQKVRTVVAKRESDEAAHYLQIKNSPDIELETQSGVSISKFIRALNKVGISAETIYEKN